MVFIGSGYRWYTKKEDVREVIDNQRKMTGIVYFSLAIVNLIMEKFIVPKLSDLMQIEPKSNLWISIILLCAGVLVFTREPNYSRVDAVAKKYGKGEMIKTRLLMDWRYEWIGVLAAGLVVGYLIYTIILPIYNITNSM